MTTARQLQLPQLLHYPLLRKGKGGRRGGKGIPRTQSTRT